MSLPFESTPGNVHTFTTGQRSYDVYKLIHLTVHIPTVDITVEELENLITCEHCWTDSAERPFSPRELLNAFEQLGSWDLVESRYPDWSDHIRKVRLAECQYPILMYRGGIIDGMHRTMRAVIEKHQIKARRLRTLPDEARYHGS